MEIEVKNMRKASLGSALRHVADDVHTRQLMGRFPDTDPKLVRRIVEFLDDPADMYMKEAGLE